MAVLYEQRFVARGQIELIFICAECLLGSSKPWSIILQMKSPKAGLCVVALAVCYPTRLTRILS